MIDISSMHIRAQLIVGGRAFFLWMRGQDSGDDISSLFFGGQIIRDIPVIESVTIEVGLGLSGGVTMVIHADAELGVALLESELLKIGNRVRLQIGYPAGGGYTPIFEGITARPDISIVEDGFQITINIPGAAFAALRSSGRRSWESASYADVIRDIADAPHNQWGVRLPSRQSDDDPIYVERRSISQNNRNDWYFLSSIARLAECEMHIRSDDDGAPVLEFLRRGDVFGAAPRYTFVYRGQIDLETRFPIIGFESSSEGVWLPRHAGGIRSADINPETGEETTPVDADQEARSNSVPRLGGADMARGAAVSDGSGVSAAQPEEGVYLTASAADQENSPQEVVTRLADEGGLQGGFQATLKTIGIPDLLPGEVIRVQGLGILGGNYLVQTANHEAGGGGWDMTLSLLRNVPGGEDAIADTIGRQLSSFNDEQGQGGGGDDVDLPVGDPEA